MMELIHCIYCSASASVEMTREELDALLAISRENNAKLGITGMLLYQSRSFFQVLEGDHQVVMPLFAKIAEDKRHLRVTTIISEPIAERAFGE
jgi:hypothetical protein